MMPNVDLLLAVPTVFFGSIGTAGQCCTFTHHLYLHCSIAPNFLMHLQKFYVALQLGNSLDACMLLGPLHMSVVADAYGRAADWMDLGLYTKVVHYELCYCS